MKPQKKLHVLDVQGIRRLVRLYGSTSMFPSQEETKAVRWEAFGEKTTSLH